MKCPHCESELTLEDIKKQITPEEITKLWSSLNGKKMTPARREANSARAKKRWADVRAREANRGNE